MVHDGEMRRSADSNRGEVGKGPGTVIVSGMSGALWRDIPVALAWLTQPLDFRSVLINSIA